MIKPFITAVGLVLCLTFSGVAFSADENGVNPARFRPPSEKPAYTLSNLTDGNHLSGNIVTEGDFAGKVVFFEYWGINCGPCLMAMPHLQELQKKYESTGKFMVFGSHVQGRDTGRINKFLAEKKITFPIYQSVYNSLDAPKGGIPYAVLIDHTGKVVKSGYPGNMYGEVDKLVKAAPETHFIFGQESQGNAKFIKMFAPGKNLEAPLSKLEADKKAAEPDQAAAINAVKHYIENMEKAFTAALESDLVDAEAIGTYYAACCPSKADAIKEKLTPIRNSPVFKKFKALNAKADAIFAKAEKKGKLSKSDAASLQKLSKEYADLDTSALPALKNAVEKQTARIAKRTEKNS